jgi:hypothetical protein
MFLFKLEIENNAEEGSLRKLPSIVLCDSVQALTTSLNANKHHLTS